MKQIINCLFAFYFSYNFIFHLNNNILYNFIYYLLFDTLYFIFFEKENKIKNDIILHHLNGIGIIYSYLNLNSIYNVNLNYYDKLFSLQELTTLIVTFKNCCSNKILIKYLNILFSYLFRHYTKITFLWHLSCSLLVISILHMDKKFVF